MQVGPAAHVGDVGEHLALRDHLAWTEARSWPHMPVLRDDGTLSGLVPDEDPALERRVDLVAGDHPVRRRPYRLDTGADVDSGMQPDRACRGTATKDCAVAKPPLAAESETVR